MVWCPYDRCGRSGFSDTAHELTSHVAYFADKFSRKYTIVLGEYSSSNPILHIPFNTYSIIQPLSSSALVLSSKQPLWLPHRYMEVSVHHPSYFMFGFDNLAHMIRRQIRHGFGRRFSEYGRPSL